MAAEEKFIVAIEIGSTKVIGIAGRRRPDGVCQVLAYAQEPSADFVRHGRINNLLKMTACLKSIKEKLERTLKKTITQAYVGMGGMGLHSVPNTVVKTFAEKAIISGDVIEEMAEDNARMPAGYALIDTITQEYRLGPQVYKEEPIGVQADCIEGHFLNIITREEVKQNIERCMRDAGLGVAGMPIAALALADCIETGMRHSGCVLVDMGAETTTVAVFKNNLLRHLAVLPLGGRNTTRDITSLSIEEGEAERLKLDYGCAYDESYNESHNPITLEGGRTIPYDDFRFLVEARHEELIKNVRKQIDLSGIRNTELKGGIILMGGAAGIKNIENAFRHFAKIQNVQVVKGIGINISTASAVGANFNKDHSANLAIALLQQGEEICGGGDLPSESDLFLQRERERIEKEQREAEAAAAAQKAAEEAEAAQKAAEEAAAAEKKNKRRRWLKNAWDKITSAAGKMVSEEDSKE